MNALKWSAWAQTPLLVLGILCMSAARAETIDPGSNPLEVRSEDGASRVRLLGRLFYDLGDIDADVAKMSARDQVESARLGLGGAVAHDFDFLLQYEMANAFRGDSPRATLKDAWIGYSGLKSWNFRIGQFLEPFSLEELTSSRYTTFMERALPNALVPEYHVESSRRALRTRRISARCWSIAWSAPIRATLTGQPTTCRPGSAATSTAW